MNEGRLMRSYNTENPCHQSPERLATTGSPSATFAMRETLDSGLARRRLRRRPVSSIHTPSISETVCWRAV